ncbi:TRAP transporter small permease subunit [Thalassotalea marina]|uniref:TRAP transporter small permease protein n=1 Tax=Thalassotalea marina TaxID=1673741 RepID=A0A919EJ99_9GAMM|nr:TRAP transporter small permease subunit [Thalassotalea marina]GHF85543.1 C4-dicarboxylate ABC transporter substrate-binding protein [Thalassotalea marina]
MPLSWLDKFVKRIDKVTELTGKTIMWFTLVMVIVSFLIVVLRYGFNLGWIAMQESVLYFHGFVFMLGAAYTLKADGHVRVDIFYQKFSQKNQAFVDLFGTLFLLFPVCFAIAFLSWDYVAASWHIMEKSGEAGGLPLVYLSKSLLILLAVTLSLQGLAEVGRNLIVIYQVKGNG